MSLKKLTPMQRLEYRFFYDAMRQFEWDLRHDVWSGRLIPTRWKCLLQADKSPKKTRITIRLDDDVVKFFRTQFPSGYQTKINEVLRSFLKLKLSNYLNGPDGIDVIAEGLEEDLMTRPMYGDWEQRQIARMGEKGE